VRFQRTLRTMPSNSARQQLKDYTMYRITDSYGTNKTAWTRKEAFAWLAVCSPEAKITNRITGRVIAARKFSRVY
jgi:hypothetical protein